jgi:hypothetical protein
VRGQRSGTFDVLGTWDRLMLTLVTIRCICFGIRVDGADPGQFPGPDREVQDGGSGDGHVDPVADRPRAQARRVSELLLRQPGLGAQFPQ